MAYETILFEVANGAARLTLNRPDRLNSFTVQMHEEVADALSAVDGARVLVLTGAGRGFCAGQDLNDRAVAPGEVSDLLHGGAGGDSGPVHGGVRGMDQVSGGVHGGAAETFRAVARWRRRGSGRAGTAGRCRA